MTVPSLLLTRPRASAVRFAERLRPELRADVTVVISPLIEIAPNGACPDLTPFAGVIFTSAHGVRFAAAGDGRPAYCVGSTTSQAALARGWRIGAVARTAADLIHTVAQLHPPAPLVHLAGAHRRGDIARHLNDLGISTSVETLYTQELRPLTAEGQAVLRSEAPVVVPLFSPRTAAHFRSEATEMRNIRIVAISPAVARALGADHGMQVDIVAAPDGTHMLRQVENLLIGGGLA